ncbi:lipoprotein-releasing ABC transporter permease subunit LolE [Arsenophonus symbiont of Ornithomya chloropus]|uniref:lipoprotein-releasing ABC transporter permease subunit LolE n=1 Tax=Arsenophonus symbiont of Ornithomya chloropus TaxID=634121 RepID=UPI0032B1C535
MADLLLTFKIALRFYKGKKKSSLVSVISIISMLGIVFGVVVLIIGFSVMNGFEYELKNRILSVMSHGQIIAVNEPYLNWKSDFRKIKNTPDIIGVSPYITFAGLLEKNTVVKAIQMIGVDLFLESSVSTLPNFVLNNAWKKFKPSNHHIILGSGVAKKLKVSTGDHINIIMSNNKLSINHPYQISVIIIGIFSLNGMLDNQLAILPLEDAQKYLGYDNGITGFQINVADVFSANSIIYNAAINVSNYVFIKSWIKDYGYMYSDIQMVRGIIYLIMILIISVASFNIVSTLVMAVKDKNVNIAILRTFGANSSLIRNIFLYYGLLVGMFSCFIGTLIGIIISLNLTSIIKCIENIFHYSFLSDEVYFINFLPSILYTKDIFFIILTTLILSLLASWYPANQATKVAPARILSK